MVKYLNPLTIFGSNTDKMAKTMKGGFLYKDHIPFKKKNPALSPDFRK